MTKIEWPAWRYGPDGQARVFQQSDDVPHGWQDAPFSKSAVAPQGRAAIIDALRARGIEFDARWSTARLAALL